MRVRLLPILIAPVILAAGCGGSSTATPEGEPGLTAMSFALTDAGCDPSKATVDSGPVTFEVTNQGAKTVKELEVIKGYRILGEVENIRNGGSGAFTLTLQPGKYALFCRYGTENFGRGTLTVTGEPVPRDRAGAEAVAVYRAYVVEQAALFAKKARGFTDAVRAGDVARARELYPVAREPYERIEPVAESFGSLDPELDAREGDVPAARWTGFHRLEKMLWVERSTSAQMTPFADKLDADAARLVKLVKTAKLQAPQVANGAKSLMDEIGASKVTGEEDRYSHTDLYDFHANVVGARAVYDALEPIVQKRFPTLATKIEAEFANVDAALAKYRRGDGWVVYTTVTPSERRALSRAIDALAEPLSKMSPVVAQ